jgi:hypothetical protein
MRKIAGRREFVVFLASTLLLYSAPAAAQQCKVYFTVVESDPHLPGGTVARMSEDQEKWWARKGSKKFPGVCYDPTKATHKIVWWRNVVGDNRHITNPVDPKFSTTVRRTRDIGYAYVKTVGAADSDNPIFLVDANREGTAHALEKAVEFLSKLK